MINFEVNKIKTHSNDKLTFWTKSLVFIKICIFEGKKQRRLFVKKSKYTCSLVVLQMSFCVQISVVFYCFMCLVSFINGSQLAKMKKSIPDMSLP